MARKVASAVTRGWKPKGMVANSSSGVGETPLAAGLLPAGVEGEKGADGVKLAVAAGEEGEPGASGEVLPGVSEVPGEDVAGGVEGGSAGPSFVGGVEGEAVDGGEGKAVDGGEGTAVSGGDGDAVGGVEGEAVDSGTTGPAVTGADGAAGEAVKAAGLAASDPTLLDGVPGVGESIVAGTAVIVGRGSDSGDSGGICADMGGSVGAGMPGELVACVEEGENRVVEGDAYGEATCNSKLKLKTRLAAAALQPALDTVLKYCCSLALCTVPLIWMLQHAAYTMVYIVIGLLCI